MKNAIMPYRRKRVIHIQSKVATLIKYTRRDNDYIIKREMK
jgi:hypothetical protein